MVSAQSRGQCRGALARRFAPPKKHCRAMLKAQFLRRTRCSRNDEMPLFAIRKRRPLVRAAIRSCTRNKLCADRWAQSGRHACARTAVGLCSQQYSQNLLTASRTLQQINNQFRSLQNQAQMLANQARNLSRFDFPARQQRRRRLPRWTGGFGFCVAELDGQTRKRFSGQFRAAVGRTNRWPMIAIVRGCTTNVRRAGPGSQAEHPVYAAFELLLPRRKGDRHVA